MYSTARDANNFGCAILGSEQLSPTITRRWLKPVSFTSTLLAAVGMPWEIFRHPLEDRVIDFYTKGGSIGLYESLIVIIPEYDVTFTVMAAGIDRRLTFNAADVVRQHFVPALEAAAKQQAAARFGGRYASANATQNMILFSVEEQPGLVVEEYISEGVNFLQVASEYANNTGRGSLKSIRAYPAELKSANQVAFRAVFNTTAAYENGVDEGKLFSPGISAWISVDAMVYGQKPLDEFIYTVDADGVAIGVECPALRMTLGRVSVDEVIPEQSHHSVS